MHMASGAGISDLGIICAIYVCMCRQNMNFILSIDARGALSAARPLGCGPPGVDVFGKL